MNINKRRSGAFAAMAISALFVSGGLVTSGSSGAFAATQSTDVERWVVPQTQAAGENYWTPERMMAAIPGDVLVEDNVASANGGSVEVGQEKKVSEQSRSPEINLTATRQTPVDHIGKVFFTLDGLNYVCSGNAVASRNESTVSTAGHCVNSGPGAFASRFIFVPAYENGDAPFGQFNATELYAPTQWTSRGDITYDTGFAIVSSNSGASLSDTVGASGVAFNENRGLTYSAFGYPAAPPFTGETLQSCYGSASDDPNGQTESQGIPCDMTGGSSGGPWFIGSGSSGYQNSVNSFGYSNVPNTMFGPYWGSVIANVYDAAAA